MVFFPRPPLAADFLSFLLFEFQFFCFAANKNALASALCRNKDDALAVPPCFPIHHKSDSLRKCQHIPRDITVTTRRRILCSPARSAVHLNDRFLRDFHQRPCSLRGRIRPLSPLHSLWSKLYRMHISSSSTIFCVFLSYDPCFNCHI